MENNYLLNKDYIRIKNMNTISYGGNQSWCKSKKMQKVGCGVIALADISIYLAESRTYDRCNPQDQQAEGTL